MMISLFRPVLARWIGAIIAALGAAGSPRANEPVIVTLPALERFEPLPELVAYAKEKGIPTEDFAEPTDPPRVPRDSAVVALVVYQTEAKTEQWLVHLIARDLTEKEKRATKSTSSASIPQRATRWSSMVHRPLSRSA